jgi:hypothetical protein
VAWSRCTRARPRPTTGACPGTARHQREYRLLRQYLARSEDLRRRDQLALDELAARLNDRPRRVLGWRTPAEVFAEAVTAAGGVDAQTT